MPSLKAIRKRIVSAKNTQKITKAMKLVSAARLRRAQEQVLAHRPYGRHLTEVVRDLAARAGKVNHPLLAVREPKRIELVVLTSDRGLCGGFNANINRTVDRLLRGELQELVSASAGPVEIEDTWLAVVGRKGRDYHTRRKRNVKHEYPAPQTPTALERAGELGNRLIAEYSAGDVDAVYIVYNEFKSAISQRVVVERLLPLATPPADEADEAGAGKTEYVYEPSKEELLAELLPMYVRTLVYRSVLESIASEFGARMSAMESATKNAKEMIARLTLQFNRARQAAITKELMEIIGGAEALKG